MYQTDIRTPTDFDLRQIYSRLRRCDRNEIRAMSGLSPKIVVTESVKMSDKVLAGYVDDEPVSVFGYCPNIVWMLGTPNIKKAPVRLMKQSLDFISEGLECYDRLGNYIDVRNVTTINWLEWLGFVFGPPVRIGYENRLFRYAFVTKGTLKNV